MMNKSILKKIYYDVLSPGSYGSVEKLYKEAKKFIPSIKRNEIKEFLDGEIVYTLHKQVRKRFKRNPVVAEHINENFQADLVDMKEFSRVNNGNNFILTIICVFSKRAWAFALKNKSANSIVNSFETLFKDVIPIKIQTDNGTEFVNSKFKSLMNEYGINHFTTNNVDIKCAVVERFNRTLKE